MQHSFGEILREMRGLRRLSQLDLGLEANVSARHIAFLETGRSRPSREMVLRLAETLDLPLSQRNLMLSRAGFAPAFGARSLDEPEMAVVRAAMTRVLDRHDPFPAFAIDRHWCLVLLNRTATLLLGAVGLGPGDSLIDATLEEGPARRALLNRAEVGRHFALRLRAESTHRGGDPVLDRAVRRLLADPDIAATPVEPSSAVIPARWRAGDAVLSFFSMIAEFGTVEDAKVGELRIELMFPADEFTRAALDPPG